MVIIRENISRRKELVQTLVPLVHKYAKAAASPKAKMDLTDRLASVLEEWDFSPKELRGLDRRAFFDLIRSWREDASADDGAVIKAVF